MNDAVFHTKNLSQYSFLVTGGAGFIGSHIVEYLLNHGAAKVRVLDNYSTGSKNNIEAFLKNNAFEFFEGDICNPSDCKKAAEGINFILHQAALGSVPRSVANPIDTHQINVTGFLNMLIASRDAGVTRFIFASSSSVYGDSLLLPKSEDKIGNPLSPYAVSKLSNELYAHVFALNYKMEIIGLRYFNVFGPRQSPDGPYAAAIPLFMKAALENKSPVIFGDGNQTRDFTFVENAVQANIKSLFAKKEAVGQIFNVAAGNKISVNQLNTYIKKIAGTRMEPTYQNPRPGEVKDSLANISKAEKLLEYKVNSNFEECLKVTFDWFKIQNS